LVSVRSKASTRPLLPISAAMCVVFPACTRLSHVPPFREDNIMRATGKFWGDEKGLSPNFLPNRLPTKCMWT
jgi:hypothetical protein